MEPVLKLVCTQLSAFNIHLQSQIDMHQWIGIWESWGKKKEKERKDAYANHPHNQRLDAKVMYDMTWSRPLQEGVKRNEDAKS